MQTASIFRSQRDHVIHMPRDACCSGSPDAEIIGFRENQIIKLITQKY